MTLSKPFEILIGSRGEGYWIAGIAVIARDRAESEARQLCANRRVTSQVHANLG
jgi:hypothetical protein